MKGTAAEMWKKQALALLGRYKFVLIVAAAGAALLLLPPLWGGTAGDAPAREEEAPLAEEGP